MRTLVLGGTRFIGLAMVNELVQAGHEVLLVHRGEHEPDELRGVPHLHVHRRQLSSRSIELSTFAPEGLIDLSAMTGDDASAALDALPDGLALVVASSMDVYRAFSSLWKGTVTDTVPLTEESAVRAEPPPDRALEWRATTTSPPTTRSSTWRRHIWLAVERCVGCRWSMGHTTTSAVRTFCCAASRAGRRRIPTGAGGFLWSRGHVAELARGIRLALERQRAQGEVFNLCESSCAPLRLWMEWILEANGFEPELVRVPDELLPDDLEITGGIAQHLLASAEKARELLGWVHSDPRERVRESVRWHLAHPPPDEDDDFAADERALARGGPA